MDLDQMQVKISLNKSNALVAFTSVPSHFTCHFISVMTSHTAV